MTGVCVESDFVPDLGGTPSQLADLCGGQGHFISKSDLEGARGMHGVMETVFPDICSLKKKHFMEF